MPDLHDLIDSATTEAAGKAVASAPRRAKKRGVAMMIPGVLLVIIVTGAAAYIGIELWRHHVPPTREKVATDLTYVVDLARRAIEDSRGATGKLPDALPNAALAAVVQYEATSTEYKLIATSGGVRVVRDWDGSISTEAASGN